MVEFDTTYIRFLVCCIVEIPLHLIEICHPVVYSIFRYAPMINCSIQKNVVHHPLTSVPSRDCIWPGIPSSPSSDTWASRRQR